MKLKRSNSSSGFTLIELLVVVAIIALLISILLPSLSNAKKQAKQILELTNEREIGSVANFYASDNRDLIPRGILGINEEAATGAKSWGHWALQLSTYLGYQGELGKPIEIWRDSLPGVQQKKVRKVLTQIKQYQCPDYPAEERYEWVNNQGYNDENVGADTQLLAYLASAVPVPFPYRSITEDGAFSDPPDSVNGWVGVTAGTTPYEEATTNEKIANAKSPSEVAYITEAHLTAPWDETRFHSFFLASHLPFGAAPRIANDQRHPGGRGVMFFDGHAEMMSNNQLDAGWGESIGKRIRWFSILAADVPESYW